MRKYESFFAEKSVCDLPELVQIKEQYPGLQWIDDYQSFRRENLIKEKNCLIFARKRGPWLKPFYCYGNGSYRFLSLDVAEGCLFDCVYCYLQTYLNHGALVLFVDCNSLAKELCELNSGPYWISTGLLSDSLLAEKQHSLLPVISQHVPEGSILELRSKSAEISPLFKPEILRDRVVISWSINPVEVVQTYEYGTASLDQRLKAASEVISLGYKVAFHLDPVFHFDDWKETYALLFKALEEFPEDRIAFISVGLFRYMPELGSMIRKRFPYHPILSGEFFHDEDGKYHYFRHIRKEMYHQFSKWLQKWKEVPIFWSMEPDARLLKA
jgi:DNA repair photolyase